MSTIEAGKPTRLRHRTRTRRGHSGAAEAPRCLDHVLHDGAGCELRGAAPQRVGQHHARQRGAREVEVERDARDIGENARPPPPAEQWHSRSGRCGPTEYGRVGDLTVAAYRALPVDHLWDGYDDEIRAVSERLETAEVLVAVLDGVVVGAVTYVSDPSSPWIEWNEPGEAQIRLLGVDPARRVTASAPRSWPRASSGRASRA